MKAIMILIIGATQNFGKEIIDFLLNDGVPSSRIAALVRNKKQGTDLLSKGITLRIGDDNDYSSLVEAFDSIDKILIIPGNDFQTRAEQYLNIVNAAKKVGVKHILYICFGRANQNATSPGGFLCRKIIKQGCIPHTIFRTILFKETSSAFFGKELIQTGVHFPVAGGEDSDTLCADFAETVANILASDGHENKEYYIANTENISFHDIENMSYENISKVRD